MTVNVSVTLDAPPEPDEEMVILYALGDSSRIKYRLGMEVVTPVHGTLYETFETEIPLAAAPGRAVIHVGAFKHIPGVAITCKGWRQARIYIE